MSAAGVETGIAGAGAGPGGAVAPWLLHQGFEQAARRWPRRRALWGAGAEGGRARGWSYAELERASRRAALRLRGLGLRRGARVGVWMRKSPEAVAALLAILRAGGVYVPLDPGAPEARIEALGADCGLWGLYADAGLAERAAGWARPPRRLELAALGKAGAEPGGLAEAAATGEDLAYILYTSGSTGVPKGVMLTHAHACNFVAWAGAEIGLGPGDRVASHAPFHFDLSIFDLWAGLGRGAAVYLLDGVTARFPRAVADWVREHRITVWYSVPSALVALLPHAGELGAGPRALLFAGEVFPTAALRAWQRALPRAQFHNWYGPTETNVCTHYRLGPGEAPEPLPIGVACPNFELALRDERGRRVGVEEAGVLWARGPGILAGYWGDRRRTAAVTRRWRGPGGRGQRWYNTGDWARQGSDGQYYYQGRRDDLIKLRGYRVSLREVAEALEGCAGVEQAVALVEAGERLVGYVGGGEGLGGAALRRQLAERLPPYMVPERIEVRAALPVTSTGKVDRQALRAAGPESGAARARAAPGAAG